MESASEFFSLHPTSSKPIKTRQMTSQSSANEMLLDSDQDHERRVPANRQHDSSYSLPQLMRRERTVTGFHTSLAMPVPSLGCLGPSEKSSQLAEVVSLQ